MCLPISEYIRRSKIAGALWAADAASVGTVPTTHPNDAGSILLVQGASSPDVIRTLSDVFHADRNVLESHFDFRSSKLPCVGHLPSRPNRFATIRFISIGSLVSTPAAAAGTHDGSIFADMAEQLDAHHLDCYRGSRLGRECFRAVESACASLLLGRAAGYILRADKGRRSLVGHAPQRQRAAERLSPWTFKHRGFTNERFFSVGASRLNACEDHPRAPSEMGNLQNQHILARPNPFRARAADDIAMSVQDQDLCSQDPFVLLADLLETSALSWMQFLNFLRELHQNLPGEATDRAALLSRDRTLVDQCVKYATETIRLIDSRDNLAWQACADEAGLVRVATIARRVRWDFEILREEAIDLASTCKDSINIAMSNISIRASEQALAEGRWMHLVTYLAFLFVPLTFVASIFGMNISKLDPPPSISLFFFLSVPMASLFVLIPAWPLLSRSTFAYLWVYARA